MTEDEVYRLMAQALKYDSLIFLWEGKAGIQPVFMPHEVYPWRPIVDTAPRRELKPPVSERWRV